MTSTFQSKLHTNFRQRAWLVSVLLVMGVAVLMRSVWLDQLPGLGEDERLFAAEAFSLRYTGADMRESGQPPLYLRGFSDAYDNRTSVLYSYLSAGFFFLLKPTVISLRLAAVLMGVTTVGLAALVMRRAGGSWWATLTATATLSVMPEHVYFSRTAQEFVVLPLLQLLLVWCFLAGRSNPKWYAVAPLCVAIGVYSYQPLKLMGPALFVLLAVLEWRQWWSHKRTLFVGLAIALLMVVPSAWIHITRWSALSAEWSYVSIVRRPDWFLASLGRYAAHFGPWRWDGVGPAGALLFALGFVRLWRQSKQRLLIAWLLVAPLAGALTNDPNVLALSHRSGGLWVLLALFIGFGVDAVASWTHILLRRFVLALASVGLAASLIFANLTFGPYIHNQSANALRAAVQRVERLPGQTREVVISTHGDPLAFQGHLVLFAAGRPGLLSEAREYGSAFHPYWRSNGEYLTRVGRFVFCDPAECFRPSDNRLYVVGPSELPQVPRMTVVVPQFGTAKDAVDIIDNR